MKRYLIFLILIMILVVPSVTYASWWNPFSWFKYKTVLAPYVSRSESATSTLPISPNTEKKEVSTSKQEVKANVLNLPDGSIVEIDSNGNILRYVKEAVKESVIQSDNYFSAQIEALSKRLNLLEQQFNEKTNEIINPGPVSRPESILINTPPSVPEIIQPKVISSVVTPTCSFRSERGLADTGNKAVTFTWNSENTSSLADGEIGEIFGKNFMDLEKPTEGYNQLIGKITTTQGNTVVFRIPFETRFYKMIFKAGAVCYAIEPYPKFSPGAAFP